MQYYIREKKTEHDFRRVSKEDYVAAERTDGFYNTMDQPDEPATSKFDGMIYEGFMVLERPSDFSNK